MTLSTALRRIVLFQLHILSRLSSARPGVHLQIVILRVLVLCALVFRVRLVRGLPDLAFKLRYLEETGLTSLQRTCLGVRTPGSLPRGLLAGVLVLNCGGQTLGQAIGGNTVRNSNTVRVWEFSPYRVTLWYAFDSTTDFSPPARQAFVEALESGLKRTFRAAWNLQLVELPNRLESILHASPADPALDTAGLERLSIDALTESELVLVTSREHPEAQTVRTFEAALEELREIQTTPEAFRQLRREMDRRQLAPDSQAHQLLAKLRVDQGGLESLNGKLQAYSAPAALVPRFNLPKIAEMTRHILTPLPWQSDLYLRSIDKLLFLTVRRDGEHFHLQVRELDCGMRFFGPTFQTQIPVQQFTARHAGLLITQAFAPIARVEDAEPRSAELRLRAGGLIIDPQNPAAVKVGDVMQPVVRRDDRNGLPTLLEPLSWTFAAITRTDGVKLEANVYTYSGGPGLQGRQNRRTRRVLLKVRPRYDATEIQIIKRGTGGEPQTGCTVYERDLLTQDFRLLGRTDWRGRLPISVPQKRSQILPEAVRKQRAEVASQAAPTQTDSITKGKLAEPAAANESSNNSSVAKSRSGNSAETVAELGDQQSAWETTTDPAAITLNQPLLLLYVKNGNTVLAKLPMVPGLKKVEVATLRDDSQRLRAEALVKGFQGEILDLIGVRNLLAAQVQLTVKQAQTNVEEREQKLKQAEDLLSQMRRLPTYNEMSKRLDQIQRDILEEDSDLMSLRTRNQIDRMFQISRNLLRVYLQDDLLSESAEVVSRLQNRNLTPPSEQDTVSEPAVENG